MIIDLTALHWIYVTFIFLIIGFSNRGWCYNTNKLTTLPVVGSVVLLVSLV